MMMENSSQSLFARFPLVVLLLLVGTLSAQAQPREPTEYVLEEVVSGMNFFGKKSPTKVEADSKGGTVTAQIRYSATCAEQYEFKWEFNRDVKVLRPGEEFTVTASPQVKGGSCVEDGPFMVAYGSNGASEPKQLRERKFANIGDKHTEGSTGRVYVKKDGSKSVKLTVAKGWGPERIWFGIDITGGSRIESELLQYSVAYVYKAKYGPATSPTPGEGTTSGGTTTSTPPGTVGTRTAGCNDPAVKRCIDEWLAKAVAILNRRVPDRAPWSISPYGHLVNNQVRSVAPPDGWETTYRSSKHCFVWATWANAHLSPEYGGELPPLHQQCGGGSGATGTTTGSTTGGTGTTSGGTSTGSGATGGTPGSVPGTGVGTGTGAGGRVLLAERRTVPTGGTVNVPVRLLNPAGVANMNFEITFDISVAVADGKPQRGSVLGGQTLFDANPGQAGRIRLGFAQETGLSPSGIVAYVPFKAVGQPGDRTPLTLSVTDVKNPAGTDLPVSLVHGEIVITSAGGGVAGDCDRDGILTVADAICALQISVGLKPDDMTMDVTKDGAVTSADARVIMQRIP